MRPAGILLLLTLCVFPLTAQFRGAIQGTIKDTSGAVIPNAKVTLTNTETGRRQTTASTAEGFYHFGDGARSGQGGALALPNATGPGGSNNAIFQTENQVPIVANGQRTSQNNFEIDGVSVNSLTWGGAAVVTPNQESVKSVRVSSSEYSAEAGRNSGAQIQVVSQNGTNQFHGSGVFKYNDPLFNAFNKFGGPNGAPPVRVNQLLRQFAASVGGPVIKDKLFFFFSYEGLRQGNTNFATSYVETAQYRQQAIAARPDSILAHVFGNPG